MNSQLFRLLLVFSVSIAALASEPIRCKYSVRDVAFVNVHGKSWQLDLVKPENVSEAEFKDWNSVLKEKLEFSNLGYAWHDSKSAKGNGSSHRLEMKLSNDNGVSIPIVIDDEDFATRIDRVVESPVRNKLVDSLTESLCVFLIVGGNDKAKNAAVKETVSNAIEQVERQMWMMEKASDKGPSIVTMDATDPSEQVTLRSIGIDPTAAASFPAVAILFGQARRLGDVLSGDDINKEKLVALASICGSDCECALDREWLYGSQMVHVWTRQHERIAEESLSFDPKSAFIMSEISQILQKNSGGGESSRVDLGAGLMIHDLEVDEVDEPEAETNTVANAEAPNLESLDEVASPPDYDSGVPWYLLACFAVAAVFVFFFKFKQA